MSVKLNEAIRKVDPNALNSDGETPLMEATYNGDLKAVDQLLNQGAEIDAQDADGWTALMCAIKFDYPEIATRLLERGANPNLKTFEDGTTALIIAATMGRLGIVRDLLDRGVFIDEEDTYGDTALMGAANDGYFYLVEELLNRGADPNHQNDENDTALIKAVIGNHFEIVRELLRRGANPNLQTEGGWTALTYAISYADNDTIKELLDYGADPNLKSVDEGLTAFDQARTSNRDKQAKFFTDYFNSLTIDPFIVDQETGISNFSIAASDPQISLRRMIDQYRDLNLDQQDFDGNTPLIYAIVSGHQENADLLLDRGANPNLGNFAGATPLDYSIDFEHPEIEQMLIKAGAK
jgi:hypothetical protein